MAARLLYWMPNNSPKPLIAYFAFMRSFALLVLIIMASCGHHHKGSSGTAEETDSDSTSYSLTTSFYKRYSGTLAGKPIVLHLNKYGNSVQGVYCYTAVGQDILLRDWNDSVKDDGVFYFNEIVPADMPEQNGEGPGWSLHVTGNTASGEWRSADGAQVYPIELTEDYPEGSTRLKAFWLVDSAALRPGDPKSPMAKATSGYLLPSEGPGSFLYDALTEQLIPKAADGEDMETAMKAAMATYFADYRKENEDAKLGGNPELEAATLAYTSDKAIYVHYNDDDWLVTESFNSAYTGGAHGIYGSAFANIDLAQKRLWKLTDMVADTTALRPLLNDAAIVYFGLKPGQDMDERMLVDEVPPTDNVYVGPKGLSFVYTPYEIASYADGQITLYLPYKKLYNLLTPAFRQRMKLSDQAGIAMHTIHKNQTISCRQMTHSKTSAIPLVAIRHRMSLTLRHSRAMSRSSRSCPAGWISS